MDRDLCRHSRLSRPTGCVDDAKGRPAAAQGCRQLCAVQAHFNAYGKPSRLNMVASVMALICQRCVLAYRPSSS